MARLSETPGRALKKGGGAAYIRCFGDEPLALLLSRVQSLIIRNGYELERMITEAVADKLIGDLDVFLQDQIMPIGVRIATKRTVKASKTLVGRQVEPDFLVFHRTPRSQSCYVVELKDGHEFDTKSSSREHQNLHQFISMNANPLNSYLVYARICGFNAQTKAEIQQGFKMRIDISQAMTGREFCELIGVDYGLIVAERAADQEANFDRLLVELLDIESVRGGIVNKLDG